MRKRSLTFLLIAVVWLFWACLAVFLRAKEIDKAEVSVKEGMAVSAHCVESRSVKGVKFRAVYSGSEVVDDYISLPLGFPCDEAFIERFKSGSLKISFYENRYLGFEIDGVAVRTVDESVDTINDKGSVLAFTFFMAFVISFSLFMYGRNQL